MGVRAVAVTAKGRAELVSLDPPDDRPLGPTEVSGPTLASLISPGTELSAAFMGESFPNYPGYAAVFRADAVGSGVNDVRVGDTLFCMGPHRSRQRVDRADLLPVPAGLDPEHAVIARLMGVTMTTLVTTAARPGDAVVVSGAGPVGYLAAHLFAHAGYEIHAVEPNEGRRTYLEDSGITRVYPSISLEDSGLAGRVALVVECSGHEQAALDACRIVRRRGEVVLVGVPWRKRNDLSMHELLHAVFHRYVVLRSGWEWELPTHPTPSQPHSIFGNLATALRLLAEGRIPVERRITRIDPAEIQAAYVGLLNGQFKGLFPVLSWNPRG